MGSMGPFDRIRSGLKSALVIGLKHKSIYIGHLMVGILRAERAGQALLVQAHVDTDALRTALEEQARGRLRTAGVVG